jgi:hypothetical protein
LHKGVTTLPEALSGTLATLTYLVVSLNRQSFQPKASKGMCMSVVGWGIDFIQATPPFYA